MADISKYLENRKGSLVALQPIKVVLKKQAFDVKLAEEVDSKIDTFGIFKIIADDGKTEFTAKFPLIISLNVIERSNDSDNVYLTYKKNDVLIDFMGFVKGPKPANRFLDLLTTGKFDGLSPEDLVDAFNENMRLNGVGTGVNAEIIEVMIAELIRWKGDTSVPYRVKYGKVPKDDFVFMPITEVARVGSVFSALSFEDTKKAVQAAVHITRTNQKQKYSPIENAL